MNQNTNEFWIKDIILNENKRHVKSHTRAQRDNPWIENNETNLKQNTSTKLKQIRMKLKDIKNFMKRNAFDNRLIW